MKLKYGNYTEAEYKAFVKELSKKLDLTSYMKRMYAKILKLPPLEERNLTMVDLELFKNPNARLWIEFTEVVRGLHD